MSDFEIAAMLLEADKFADENKYIDAAEKYLQITNIDNNCTPAWYGLGTVSYTHLTLPTIYSV